MPWPLVVHRDMAAHLILVLEGPLLAFGAEAVDARGVVGDFPTASMLTGLLANALGWRRTDRTKLARLQERLVFGARIDRVGTRLTDFQTAQIAKSDSGWTTRGAPEGRAGGAATYSSPHIRRRDFDADARVTVALRLEPVEEAPMLPLLADALRKPARPLFMGRKPCLPERPVFERLVEDAPDLLAALCAVPTDHACRIMLPDGIWREPADERRRVTDQRNWVSGVHGGSRAVLIRSLPARSESAP